MSDDLLNGVEDKRIEAQDRRVFMTANVVVFEARTGEIRARYARDRKALQERQESKRRFAKAEEDSETQALEQRLNDDLRLIEDDLARARKIVWDNRQFPQRRGVPGKKMRTKAERAALNNELLHLCMQYTSEEMSTDKIAAMVGTNGPDVSKARNRFARKIEGFYAQAAEADAAWAAEKAAVGKRETAPAVAAITWAERFAATQAAPEPDPNDDDSMFAFDYGGL